jgi:hypothetical protein
LSFPRRRESSLSVKIFIAYPEHLFIISDMTRTHLFAKSALFFLAICAFSESLNFFQHAQYASKNFDSNSTIMYACSVACLAIAILILFTSDRFAAFFSKNSPSPQTQFSPPVIFAFLRVPAVFYGILIISYSLSTFRFIFQYYAGETYDLMPDASALIGLFRIAWGIYLLLGAPYLIDWQVRRTFNYFRLSSTKGNTNE